MLIVADANMPMLDTFFAGFGEIRRLPGREIDRQALAGADVLLVRSVTRVDAALVAGSRLRFVGSATAGCDHVDRSALERAGIAFAHAPGCNAEAVADYVIAAAMELLGYELKRLRGLRVGVVGCGECGGRVRARFEALGAEVRVCDPPRLRAGLGDAQYVAMQQIYDCDLISLHVPLQDAGRDRTRDFLDIDALRPGCLLINAARGELLDGRRLLRRLQAAQDLRVVLDVWPGEPSPDPALVQAVDLATPHIAGYSLDGKWRGTAMLYEALCRHLGLQPALPPAARLPAATAIDLMEETSAATPQLLRRLLAMAYDIRRDDADLRGAVDGDAATHAQAFDRLRRHYRQRRDFAAHPLLLPDDPDLLAPIRALGFQASGQA